MNIISGKKLFIKSLISSPAMELSSFFISYLDQSMTRRVEDVVHQTLDVKVS